MALGAFSTRGMPLRAQRATPPGQQPQALLLLLCPTGSIVCCDFSRWWTSWPPCYRGPVWVWVGPLVLVS